MKTLSILALLLLTACGRQATPWDEPVLFEQEDCAPSSIEFKLLEKGF